MCFCQDMWKTPAVCPLMTDEGLLTRVWMISVDIWWSFSPWVQTPLCRKLLANSNLYRPNWISCIDDDGDEDYWLESSDLELVGHMKLNEERFTAVTRLHYIYPVPVSVQCSVYSLVETDGHNKQPSCVHHWFADVFWSWYTVLFHFLIWKSCRSDLWLCCLFVLWSSYFGDFYCWTADSDVCVDCLKAFFMSKVWINHEGEVSQTNQCFFNWKIKRLVWACQQI